MLLVGLFLSAGPVHADIGNDHGAIALHISPPVTKSVCGSAPSLTSSDLDTGPAACDDGAGGPAHHTVWVLVCNGSDSLGVAGMEFGLDYSAAGSEGVDVDGWTLCADLEFPNPAWPAAGTGTIITWDPIGNCQDTLSEPFVPRTVIAIAGALDVTVHGPDLMRVTPRPSSGHLKIADCGAAESDLGDRVPYAGGVAGFCQVGYNPCISLIPARPMTWGSIKRLD